MKNVVLQQRNKEAEFLALIGRHQGILHKICSVYEQDKNDQQDLFQEIIIQLWKNFDQFKKASSFSTWMYRVAINTAISAYHKQKRKVTAAATSEAIQTIPDSTGNTEVEEQVQMLYNAIRNLSRLERAIVMLYLEGKSYKEIEEIVGIKEGTLRVKMNRLKEKLRHLLTSEAYGT